MSGKSVFKKCHGSLRKAPNNRLRNKLPKSPLTLWRKRSLWSTIWTKDKFSQSENSIPEIRFLDLGKLIPIKRKMTIQSLNNSTKNYSRWKNKPISPSVKYRQQPHKSTKESEMAYWLSTRPYTTRRDKNSNKIVTKLRTKSMRMTSTIT